MPTARRSRMIAASVEELWELISDPHHLPRWWPRVARVEDVEGDAFTEVMKTARGKVVRAVFKLVEADDEERALRWRQQVDGTPFARLLRSAETEVRLAAVAEEEAFAPAPARAATEVAIELRQSLNGILPRLGGALVRRAAASTIEQALDGLERISG